MTARAVFASDGRALGHVVRVGRTWSYIVLRPGARVTAGTAPTQEQAEQHVRAAAEAAEGSGK